MRKEPKKTSFIKKSLGAVIIFEAVTFGVCYFAWRHLNTSREARRTTRDKYPWVLEYFYKVGEIANKDDPTRQTDATAWKYLDSLKSSKSNQ